MSEAAEPFDHLPSEDRDKLEEIVRRFEDAWQRGEPPAVADYVPADVLLGRAVLIELIHIDLEYRLAVDERARLEAYLTQFPQVVSDRRAMLSLIVREQELRRRREPNLALDEYQQRFPEYYQELLGRVVLESTTSEALQPPASPPPGREQGEASRTSAVESELPRIPGYELLEVLDEGGMGVVYKARQVGLDRLVALKMILGGGLSNSRRRARFRLEAQAVARLRHPHIVPIYEVGEAQGLPYFSLEYVEGGSLAQKLRGGRLPVREAAGLVETLARAMHYAHGQGIIHRDLKPGNVLLTVEGEPKITDFGLAKLLGAGEGQTVSGDVLGTPNYMAPEQAEGDSRRAGPATDVYGLGAILYELLTGRPPFQAETRIKTALQVLTEPPVPPGVLRPEVPRELERICLRCLEKEAGDRYPSAAARADRLQHFRESYDQSLPPSSAPEPEPECLMPESKGVSRTGAASTVTDGPGDNAPARAASPSDAAGVPEMPRIAGYEILGVVDRGGMGIVYKARQLSLKRLVALKMVLGLSTADAEATARFRAEAEALARLCHPHIVQVYDFGVHDGHPFFSMEFMEGGTSLARKLGGQPQPPHQAARLVETLARTMHFAHQQGIIHRDLKPANVLLDRHGTLKIADFGLAEWLDERSAFQEKEGDIAGTPAYMAPEAFRGRVSPATDVYGLGAVLYEVLTGRAPFRGASLLELFENIATQEPVPLRQLQPRTPRALETLCLKCLAKDPGQRPPSAKTLADELQAFLKGRWWHRWLGRPSGQ
jgi:serine/threonine protein kinase